MAFTSAVITFPGSNCDRDMAVALEQISGTAPPRVSHGDAALPGREVRLLLVGAGRPYSASEVGRALGLAVVGSIEWDPDRAAVFSHGAPPPPPRGLRRLLGSNPAATFASSAYQRSVRATGEALRALVDRSEQERARWIAPTRKVEENR